MSPLASKRATQRTALAMLTPKRSGRRVARHALLDHRPHNPFAKIVGKRHHPPPPSRGGSLNYTPELISAIPRDFNRLGNCSSLP